MPSPRIIPDVANYGKKTAIWDCIGYWGGAIYRKVWATGCGHPFGHGITALGFCSGTTG